MNMRVIGGLCALAFLGACGPASEKEADVTVDEARVTVEAAGNTTSITSATATAGGVTGNGATASDSGALPAFAPLYPGAEIRTRVASASSAEGTGSLIAMRTADPMEKVVEYYDRKGQSAPGQAKIVTNDKDASVRIYGSESSGEGALVAISRDTSGSGTVIVITAGTGPIAPKDEAEAAKVAASQGARLQ